MAQQPIEFEFEFSVWVMGMVRRHRRRRILGIFQANVI